MRPQKVYRGIRGNDRYGIMVNDQPLHHVMIHSPTGFCWGYHGSGPADAALSILADHFNEKPTREELYHGVCHCWALHQDFKSDVVAKFPMDQNWELTAAEIDDFLKRHAAQLADADEKIQFWKAIQKDEQQEASA